MNDEAAPERVTGPISCGPRSPRGSATALDATTIEHLCTEAARADVPARRSRGADVLHLMGTLAPPKGPWVASRSDEPARRSGSRRGS
jgi:hypothetical protein